MFEWKETKSLIFYSEHCAWTHQREFVARLALQNLIKCLAQSVLITQTLSRAPRMIRISNPNTDEIRLGHGPEIIISCLTSRLKLLTFHCVLPLNLEHSYVIHSILIFNSIFNIMYIMTWCLFFNIVSVLTSQDQSFVRSQKLKTNL